MRFVFFGTPEFAAIVLKKLIDAGYMPSAVVCNPDEPVGRKKILTFPPVKRQIMNYESEIKNNIKIFQPGTKSELLAISDKLRTVKPDLAVVAAYGKILPKEILGIPSRGFINVHPSRLPKYRGASPIQAAILNGDSETGVTIMEIDEKMDHGGIISNIKIKISNDDNYESLSGKLARLGAELLIKTIQDYISGKIKPIPQKHNKATYTKIIKKEDGKIDWSKSANEIEKMTRAYFPWPSVWTIWNGKILKILKTELFKKDFTKSAIADFVKWPIGRIYLYNDIITVKCGENILIIKKLQLEGGKVLLAQEFLNGHKDFIGSILK